MQIVFISILYFIYNATRTRIRSQRIYSCFFFLRFIFQTICISQRCKQEEYKRWSVCPRITLFARKTQWIFQAKTPRGIWFHWQACTYYCLFAQKEYMKLQLLWVNKTTSEFKNWPFPLYSLIFLNTLSSSYLGIFPLILSYEQTYVLHTMCSVYNNQSLIFKKNHEKTMRFFLNFETPD